MGTKRISRSKKIVGSEESEPIQKNEEKIESDDESSSAEDSSKDEIEISNEEVKHAIALAASAASKKFGWNQKINLSSKSNPLSEIIPGYVAPMTLDSSSLDQYKTKKRSLATPNQKDSINVHDFSKNFKKTKPDPAMMAKRETSAGSGWFDFEASPYTPEIQADIAIIRNRNYIDPKKFYKSSDFGKKGSQSRMVQLGTVIEGSMESVYSNRLTKKQQKSNVMEEVMGDVYGSKDAYVKKKYTKMQKESSAMDKKSKKFQRNKKDFGRKGRR